MSFRRVDPEEPPADEFLAASEASLTEMYGPTTLLPRHLLLEPDGCYLLASRDGTPVAGGGFTRHDEVTAEIRRMYVVPAARSAGVARALLSALEESAARAGYRRVILDTGDQQPHAESLYRSAGYLEIENCRGPASRASFWGAKDL